MTKPNGTGILRPDQLKALEDDRAYHAAKAAQHQAWVDECDAELAAHRVAVARW